MQTVSLSSLMFVFGEGEMLFFFASRRSMGWRGRVAAPDPVEGCARCGHTPWGCCSQLGPRNFYWPGRSPQGACIACARSASGGEGRASEWLDAGAGLCGPRTGWCWSRVCLDAILHLVCGAQLNASGLEIDHTKSSQSIEAIACPLMTQALDQGRFLYPYYSTKFAHCRQRA